MNILFLSAWYPYPPNNGSKLRIYNLLRGLAQRHRVTLLTFADEKMFPLVQAGAPAPLAGLCQAVHVICERPYRADSQRALLGLLSPKPRVLVDRFVPEMQDRIDQELTSRDYDLVVASQWYMADYLAAVEGPPAIFEEAEIGVFFGKVDRAGSLLGRMRHSLTLFKMNHYYRRLLGRFAACTVASDTERDLLNQMAPDYSPVEVIPNGVDLNDYRQVNDRPDPNTLVFTGSFRYHANYEAMQWFMEQVFPLVREEVPDLRIIITGKHDDLPLAWEEAVTRTGYVQDIRPVIASGWGSLAPLLTGGGTRLKILEAMALRTPVVSTSKGAEGLVGRHEEHLLIADSPEEFAFQTLRLLREPDLRRRLARDAYHLVETTYDWRVVWPQFLALIDDVSGSGHDGGFVARDLRTVTYDGR